MRRRREALATLAALLAPAAAAAKNEAAKGTAKRAPAPGRAPAKGKAQGGTPKPPPAARASGTRNKAARRPSASDSAPKTGSVGPNPEPDDAPSLRPVDREQIQGWLAGNPDWTPPDLPPGQWRRLARGRPLPPGIAGQALPPGLAMRLPYFPGFRYLAVGPDLVLVDTGTGVVTSLLPGAFAR